MGRQQFAVNRKYKSGSVSMRKPGIFMKQRNHWPGVEGASLTALCNRYYHIDIDAIASGLPEKMCHHYWAVLWATLCIAIDRFPRVTSDDMTNTEIYYYENSVYICRTIAEKLSKRAEYKTHKEIELQSLVSARDSEIC